MSSLAMISCFVLASAEAGQIEIQPPQVHLTGPEALQRILVLQRQDGKIQADFTSRARLSSADSRVAQVDGGNITPRGNGETVITAEVDGQKATARVKVVDFAQPFDWNFRTHALPVLTRLGCNSGACHGALAGKGGFKLSLRGYAPQDDHFVLTRQARGRRINTSEPAQSLLLLKPTMAVAHGGGLKLEVNSPEYKVLAGWIASGAAGLSARDPQIQRLEVFPQEAYLAPRQTMQIVVRAWYSDGHAEDVTRWARFNSTDDQVASVTDDGKARGTGHGAAAITVMFANLVAVVPIVSPYPHKLDRSVFTKAERRNTIDDLVLNKLEALRIPPSPLCGDSEFMRRAYLDAAGILPTPDEMEAFLADRRADKRSRLVDALLDRPEFVDYWSYKWSDLLLISSRKLPVPAMRSFYQFVRQAVADNKPWDRFTREIITARGDTLQNGAGNYYVLHKGITDLTETTAVTFLGMSLTCARCHNHPLEKWSQDQYWSMASLFARVAIKNGDRADELIVQSLPDGEVLHPRHGIPMPPAPLGHRPLADDRVDRRQYLADWLTGPDNPLFARALVNRVWRNFLGRGLVEAEDDLRQTNPASNEELFDALARDFVKSGYDVKHLIRTILNSATYQRSSAPSSENKLDDRYYSHYLVRRLPAEVVLDAYSQVTGVPTLFDKIGDKATKDYPPGTRALQLPDTQLVSQFLSAFGRPERQQTCACERQEESSVAQTLHLSNGRTLNDKLRDKKSRVEDWLTEKLDDDQAIRRIYLLALGRSPTAAERDRLGRLMAEGSGASRREVLEDLFWAVLTSKEFLFNH